MSPASSPPRIVAISGGVGGAKLSLGLAHLLGDRLSIIVNAGDDFEHLGLSISPDVDTTLYTLADIVNPETGWGRRDETWTFMANIARLGGADWFHLGDSDLALHVERTRRLRAGETLTAVMTDIAAKLGIRAHVLPMSDQPVRTLVDTPEGTLGFQDYFVRLRCAPVVSGLRFAGAEHAAPSRQVLAALADPTLAGIVICPSNPWLSVDPILAVPGMREAIRAARVPVIAVTPIIAGQAVKGPTAKIMGELGLAGDAVTIARHYEGLIDAFVLDAQDEALAPRFGMPVHVAQTLMRTREDKIALAATCLDICAGMGGRQ